MNDEELTSALEGLPPQAPGVDGWARRARRRSQTRRGVAVAAVLVVGLGLPTAYLANSWQLGLTQTPVAPEVFASPTHTPELLPSAPSPVEVRELTGIVTIQGDGEGNPPRLCAAPTVYSTDGRLAACEGPSLKGELFSWEALEHREKDDALWTDETYRVYGYFDPEDGPTGSFTLSRPVEFEEPDPLRGDEARPAICEDPYLGTALEKVPTTKSVPMPEPEDAALDVVQRSTPLIEAWAPTAEWWVDEQVGALNVVFLGEPAEADELRAALREVTDGPLCVVASDPAEDSEIRQEVTEFFEQGIAEPLLQYVDTSRLAGPFTVTVWEIDDELRAWLGEIDTAPDEAIEIIVQPLLHPVDESGDPIVIHTR